MSRALYDADHSSLIICHPRDANSSRTVARGWRQRWRVCRSDALARLRAWRMRAMGADAAPGACWADVTPAVSRCPGSDPTVFPLMLVPHTLGIAPRGKQCSDREPMTQ